MKRICFILVFSLMLNVSLYSQNSDDFTEVTINKVPEHVQPMTGIVFWDGQHVSVSKKATSMEFSYMLYSDVVSEEGVYDWSVVEDKLDAIASRKHQAVLRFRYVYVGEETAVPDYIKALPDYHETEGVSEGETTWFPDWSNETLKQFTLDFYTEFAEKYDEDPRLAFVETGFGLWAEYHIYDGPFELGVTFPSIEFQDAFFRHLDTTFIHTPFMISIDAASLGTTPPYTPFHYDENLLDIPFGLFDDSFMHDGFGDPGEYNTESWHYFGSSRYQVAPAGGEFSYYSNYDQRHVLDYPDGPYGKPYEYFADQFHITFIIGNDQPLYQSTERIKQASMASGYMFKIKKFLTKPDSSLITVQNVGVAPIYYDAFVAVNGTRSEKSLKGLLPGDTLICEVSAGGENPVLTIESDRLVEGQQIEYYGTENHLGITKKNDLGSLLIFPNPVRMNDSFIIQNRGKETIDYFLYSLDGVLLRSGVIQRGETRVSTTGLSKGVYLLKAGQENGKAEKLIIQ